TLRVAGYDTGLPMPYALLNLLPPLRLGQRPIYMIAFGALLLSLLAAYGLVALWSTRATRLLALGCLACAAVEYYPGVLPTDQPQLHPFFASLAAQPHEALLELPDLWWSSASMRDQLSHHWPITGGYIARRDGRYPFMHQTPGVRQLWSEQPFENDVLAPSEE